MSKFMAMLGYKPVETAPKDRRIVLAGDGIPEYAFVGRWHPTKERWGFARANPLTGIEDAPDTVDPQPKLWREVTPAEYAEHLRRLTP